MNLRAANGICLFLALIALWSFWMRRSSASNTETVDFESASTVCGLVRHPEIDPGLVVARPSRVARYAVAKLGLPSECEAALTVEQVVNGVEWVFSSSDGSCRLVSGDPLPGAGRLLCGLGIDLNSADAETLRLLPGIGEVKAARIVQVRDSDGVFESLDALTEVPGIGRKTVRKLAPWLVFDKKSTDSRLP